MKALLKEYGLGFSLALALHVALALTLLFNMTQVIHSGSDAPMHAEFDPMQAVIVDEAQVQAEIQRLEAQEQTQKDLQILQIEEQERLKAELLETQLARKAEAIKSQQLKEDAAKALQAITQAKQLEENNLAQLRLKQEKIQKELQILQEQQKKEASRLEEEATRDRVEDKEQKRLAALDKKKSADKTRKAEEDKKANAKKKAELDAKAAGVKAQAAKAAREQHLKFVDSEVARLTGEMTEKIRSHKTTIFGLASDLATTVDFRVLPDGSVVDLKMIQSSGHAAYDSTAINAILKAAPFAVSPDPDVMSKLKSITLKVKNED